MASLLLGNPVALPSDPEDVKGKKKKIPKVAGYVAGAAFAITTGLTILIIPYVRQAAKLQNTTQFLSHRNLSLLDARTKVPRAALLAPISTPNTVTVRSNTGTKPSTVSSSNAKPSSSTSTSPLSIHDLSSVSDTPIDPSLLAARSFNAREEKSLYGAPLTSADGEPSAPQEPVSGFLGFQALGIATALVFGSAGLGALIVAKLLGVQDMAEFSSKMRETLNLSMPNLVQNVNQPGRSTDGFDGEAIEQWVAKLEKEDEEEENRLLSS
ncbi:uncharacterized protein IL334_007437 [Kwoniella shivajii]|uniref:Transmembrane protein 242 n=1 Tax=Kwoniella shivajii TaxID=564305 RepID=A0ABZ1DAH7_9TREE|nr:hypothetical protein IL334_007437 [Kwoniella shivajii]